MKKKSNQNTSNPTNLQREADENLVEPKHCKSRKKILTNKLMRKLHNTQIKQFQTNPQCNADTERMNLSNNLEEKTKLTTDL